MSIRLVNYFALAFCFDVVAIALMDGWMDG